MASITSLSNSSYSSNSIYGSRNVLSGLASGMDTETMIENAVSGIKMKISKLQQRRTKLEWQQEAYRSIIDKMYNVTQKYTSYSSSTNLMSNSFFSNAVSTSTVGTNKDWVTASGKTSSDVKLLGVKQLAQAATYTVSGLGGASPSANGIKGVKGDIVSLDEAVDVSNVSGTLSVNYGRYASFDITLEDNKTYDSMEALAEEINKQLGEYTYNGGENSGSGKASDYVEATVQDGRLVLAEKSTVTGSTKGNSVTVSMFGKISDTLNADKTGNTSELTLKSGKSLVGESTTVKDSLEDKELKITLNGVTKTIDTTDLAQAKDNADFKTRLEEKINKAFGEGKLDLALNETGNGGFSLSITPKEEGTTLNVSGSAASALGFSTSSANYVDTGKKLSELMNTKSWSMDDRIAAKGEVKQVKTDKETYYVDEEGNRVVHTYDDPEGAYYRVDSDGKYLYDFKINGATIAVSEDTTMESLVNAINSNPDAGARVSYSKTTGEFKFTATESGANSKIELEGVAADIFGGGTSKSGQDAIISMEVNGKTFDGITRSENSFDVDGLTINLKGAFGDYGADNKLSDVDAARKDAVSFETTTDTDKIVDAIKSFVNDYNEMVTELKSAYSTLPATKSDNSRYDPLTDEDMEGMSESAIARYEETAKQGILFGDSNLSRAYDKLRSAITPGGSDGQILREIGIGTSYSDGLTTISLDETKLRAALESDPDKVKNAFTKTKEGGATSDGLMTSMKNALDTYAKTTGEPKGALIVHAGSTKAPTSLNSNSLLTQMNNLDKQIERWQDKMSSQIDRYTTQFSKLEQLIAEMNSQSSALSGLMGGYSSY